MTNSFKSLLMASCISLALVACNAAETTTSPASATEQALPVMTDAASYGKAAAEWQLSTIDDLSYLPNRIGTVTTKFSELFMRALLNAILKLA